MTWSGAQRIASGARCPFLGRCSPRQKALGVAASPMEAGLAHCEHPARRNGLPPHPAALERSARPTTRLAHPRRPQAASYSPSSTSPCGLKQQPDESTWVAGSSEATCVGRHRVLLPVLIAGEATQPAARNLMRTSTLAHRASINDRGAMRCLRTLRGACHSGHVTCGAERQQPSYQRMCCAAAVIIASTRMTDWRGSLIS